MQAEVTSQPPATRETVGVPTDPSPYLVVYGPLGIGWAITLAIAAVLWRDRNAQRREFLAELQRKDAAHQEEIERRERECRTERDEHRTTVATLAKEANEVARAVNEKWHDHARELRSLVDSATRKIGRRSE